MLHLTNELSFDRPAGLHDRTHHILSVAEDGPSPFTLVISRSRAEEREPLAAVADRIVAELSRTLEGFTLLSRSPAIVAGVEGAALQFKWQQSGQTLFQKQVAILLEDDDGRHIVQLTATATEAAKPEHIAMFETVLASIKIRSRDGH